MLFQCMSSVTDSDTALNQQRRHNPEVQNYNLKWLSKKYNPNSYQSVIIKITQQNSKWPAKKN